MCLCTTGYLGLFLSTMDSCLVQLAKCYTEQIVVAIKKLFVFWKRNRWSIFNWCFLSPYLKHYFSALAIKVCKQNNNSWKNWAGSQHVAARPHHEVWPHNNWQMSMSVQFLRPCFGKVLNRHTSQEPQSSNILVNVLVRNPGLASTCWPNVPIPQTFASSVQESKNGGTIMGSTDVPKPVINSNYQVPSPSSERSEGQKCRRGRQKHGSSVKRSSWRFLWVKGYK